MMLNGVYVCKNEDKLILKFDDHGTFSVKKLTSLLGNSPDNHNDDNLGWIRKLKIPPKVQCFIWLAYLGRIPTKEFLVSRGASLMDKECSRSWCHLVVEEYNHLLFNCVWSWEFCGEIYRW